MTAIEIPELGESIQEAEVIDILVSEGDQVEEDQGLLELQTDKASIEMPCPEAGVVESIDVSVGDSVKVGQAVIQLRGADGDTRPERSEARNSEDREGTGGARDDAEGVANRDRPEGRRDADEKAEADADEKAEAEADADEKEKAKADADEKEKAKADEDEDEDEKEKAEAKAKAKADGDTRPERSEARNSEDREGMGGARDDAEGVANRDRPEGRSDADEEAKTKADDKDEPSPPPPRTAQSKDERGVAAAPSTRRLATELGVDIEEVAEARGLQRVTNDDVLMYAGRSQAGREKTTRARLRPETRAAVDKLETSWREIPHVTHHDHANIAALERARAAMPEERRVSLTAVLVKVAAVALRHHPKLNARFDAEAREIVYNRAIHIGVATDTKFGLYVPVVHDAGELSTRELDAEIRELADRARARKASPEDLQGGTFTISNVGGIGGTYFTPIIHHPEVAILGVGRAEEVRGASGDLERRLPLSLSYDHRLINGADAARFTVRLVRYLESPLELIADC